MKKMKHYISASIGLILFVSVVAFSLPQIGRANFPPDKDVLVVNTPAQPVPVAGNVGITGTPTVNAKQSGAWSVGITGTPTVQVGNDPDNPALMRDIDRPTAQPFQYHAVVTLEEGQMGQNASIPIPVGKLLVIEHVSAYGAAAASQRIQTLAIHTHVAPDNTLRPHYLQYVKQEAGVGNFDYTVSQQTRIYADTPGAAAYVFRAVSTGTATFRFTVSGYFVDKY